MSKQHRVTVKHTTTDATTATELLKVVRDTTNSYSTKQNPCMHSSIHSFLVCTGKNLHV